MKEITERLEPVLNDELDDRCVSVIVLGPVDPDTIGEVVIEGHRCYLGRGRQLWGQQENKDCSRGDDSGS